MSGLSPDRMRALMLANAAEITRLKKRVTDTARFRTVDASRKHEWEQACAEFRARYDALAFPGGYEQGLERIRGGDEAAVEAGICFLECRPYFFRSGYMYKELFHRLRRAGQTRDQAARLAVLEERLSAWRERRALARKKGRDPKDHSDAD